MDLVQEEVAEVVDQHQRDLVAVAELLPARVQRLLEEKPRLLQPSLVVQKVGHLVRVMVRGEKFCSVIVRVRAGVGVGVRGMVRVRVRARA